MHISFYFSLCIIIRISLIYLAYISLYSPYLNPFFSLFYLTIGVGSAYQYITKYRKYGAFGQKIWWDYLRPFHAIFYLFASFLIYTKNTLFVLVLIIDTLMGIVGHISKEFKNKRIA